jgi:sulfatase modifying factor 1
MLLALTVLFACGPDAPEAVDGRAVPPGPPSGPPGPNGAPPLLGPPPGGGPAGTSPFEDLSGSWRDALAAPVGATPACAREDRDGDGFVAAQGCPAGDPATLDCDDADSAVTPATERWVRPGPFLMGSASDHAGRDEGPVHVVVLAGYCLDRHEATAQSVGAWLVGAKRRATGADLANLTPDGATAPGKATHPATGLTWEESRDYCASRGLALPTEAQWEKAARGGCEGGSDSSACDAGDLRAYPWGRDAPSCERANHQLSLRPGPGQLCAGDTLPVDSGAQGAGPYGHLHLSGNAWEWVADGYHPRVYGEGATRTDPTGPAGGATHHGMRGGGWSTYSTNMRAANRFSDLIMGSAVGVRCARPTAPGTADAVAPLPMVTLRGEVVRRDGALAGRALYVTAFDEADVDPGSGRLAPGRSPVAEVRLVPDGSPRMVFALPVPKDGTYRVSAALDGGAPVASGAGFRSPSGSGGVGHATRNPVRAVADADGVEIVLVAGGPPQGGPPQGGAHPHR